MNVTDVSFFCPVFLFSMGARCAFPAFDCADRNPCQPTLCESGISNYPGSSPRKYVSCGDGCSEEQCPRRQVCDQDAQRCVSKDRPTPLSAWCSVLVFLKLTLSSDSRPAPYLVCMTQ